MVKALLSFVLLLCLTTASHAQTGCQLTEWISSIPANSDATPERTANLRDTTVLVKGQQRTISLPPGFTFSQYAEIGGTRGVTLSPDGVLYVTGRTSGGAVYALPDHNRDGHPDSIITIRSGLGGSIHGIGFIRGQLYYSTDSRFARLVNTDGDREAESTENIASFVSGGHSTRTFVYDTTRRKIYIQVGSSCNICEEDNEERATIVEMNLDGSERRVYAKGLRNAVGLDIDPRTGALWANSNDADNVFGQGHPLTNENPKEPVFIICDGAHYGWPHGYGVRMRYPSGVGVDTSFFATMQGPVAQLLAHSAPLGLHFLRGKKFPSRYHGAVFQSYHGSWNRTPPAPPRVTALWSDPNGQNAILEDVVTGFQNSNGNRWGRVVAVAEGKDGALYVTDDHAGVVYRIAYTGEAGRSISFGFPSLEGLSFITGQEIAINWSATNVDSFRVLARLTPGGIPDTLIITKSNFFAWTAPNTNTRTASIRIESMNGLTFAETGYFRIATPDAEVRTNPVMNNAVLLVSPNPATHMLEISVTGYAGHVRSLELVNVLGHVVRKVEIRDDASMHLPLEEIAQGNYILRAITDDGALTANVVISR